MTPEQRKARARIAGLTAHANGRTNVGPATAAAEARYALEARQEAAERAEDITEAEVQRRAAIKRKLFYARLSYQSAKVRSARKRARQAA